MFVKKYLKSLNKIKLMIFEEFGIRIRSKLLNSILTLSV